MSSSDVVTHDAGDLAEFHRPAYRDWRWLETCWFSCFIPERGMRVHLRAAFRSNLGVVQTMVGVYSRSGGVLDMDFYDSQAHQPISATARYSDFSLPSGLRVKGRPVPDRYAVDFESRCGRLQVHLDCQALMPPVDLAFTRIDHGVTGFAAFHGPPRGDASVGHVDQTFRVIGSLTLDGEEVGVDCVSNHDHSWSPRSEFRSRCGTFDEFHFGGDLTLLAQTSQVSPGTASVSHGYLLVGNQLRRLRSAEVTFDQIGHETRSLTYVVVDETGESHEISATVRASVAQDQGSNGLTVMSLCDATWRGRTGTGESMWHWDIPEVQRRIRAVRRERGADIPAAAALAAGWS